MPEPRRPSQGPAWASSTRRSTLPPNWPTIRRRVLERDGWRCTAVTDGQRCTNRANQVDHITRGAGDHDSNLASLCAHHHARKSSAEGNAARRRLTARRQAERHPGLAD